jgi:hypothetical protein
MTQEEQDIKNVISSKHCSVCGGETEGFKCPECGTEKSNFDPMHWRNCAKGGKMQAKCKTCNESETNCQCA